IEQVGKGIIILVKEMLVKLGAGDDLAAMDGEVFEDGELARRENDGNSGTGGRAGAGIKDDIANLDLAARLVGAAADEGAETREQFRQIEWFDEIIVRPGVEAFHAV